MSPATTVFTGCPLPPVAKEQRRRINYLVKPHSFLYHLSLKSRCTKSLWKDDLQIEMRQSKQCKVLSHEQMQFLHLGDGSVLTASQGLKFFEGFLKNLSQGRRWHPLTWEIRALIHGFTHTVQPALVKWALHWELNFLQCILTGDSSYQQVNLCWNITPVTAWKTLSTQGVNQQKSVCPASKLSAETPQITPADAFLTARALGEVFL